MARVRTKKRDGNGKPIQPSWKENPAIMMRVKVVETLWAQGIHRTMEAVNDQLSQQHLPPVSYDTIKADRQRLLDLYRDRVLEGGHLENHVTELRTLISQAMRDALSAPAGPMRAPLYAVALRAHEDLMRIDGTWSRGILGLNGGGESLEQVEERFAPDPVAMAAAGLVTPQDVAAHLRLLAARTRRLPAGDGKGDVIEGTARDVTPAPNRARPPQLGAGATKVVQAVPRPKPRIPDRQRSPRPPAPPPYSNGNGHREEDQEDAGLTPYVPSPWE